MNNGSVGGLGGSGSLWQPAQKRVERLGKQVGNGSGPHQEGVWALARGSSEYERGTKECVRQALVYIHIAILSTVTRLKRRHGDLLFTHNCIYFSLQWVGGACVYTSAPSIPQGELTGSKCPAATSTAEANRSHFPSEQFCTG